jgi:hypothetical protein
MTNGLQKKSWIPPPPPDKFEQGLRPREQVLRDKTESRKELMLPTSPLGGGDRRCRDRVQTNISGI